MNKRDRRLAIGSQQKFALIALMAMSLPARADLALETETARLVEPGHYAFGAAGEYQISPDGKEYAVPMAFEFGVVHRLELLLEPVPTTSIQPNDESSVTGAGDLETTLTYLMAEEQQYLPALAIAHENPTPVPTTPADVAPEVAAEEVVGTAGVRFHLTRAFDVFTTFSYDNNQAKLFRAGFNVNF